jgi:23S rRNA-/tRNA-specific pseudouridylate synthase
VNPIGADFWRQVPLGEGVTLLGFLPCGLAAFSKPAGTLSHPNEPGEEGRSLLNARYSFDLERYEWGAGQSDTSQGRLWLLNRLDSSTSGVILVAANEELAATIKTQFRNKRIHKRYNALVFGTPSVPEQVWRDRLSIQKKGAQVRTASGGIIPCESHMHLIRRNRGQPLLSLIQLDPRTGRSHQLRVQCALRKLPIVGDATYGDFAANRRFAKERGFRRLFLHSLETHFEFEFNGRIERFQAKAPLPEDFLAALRA